MKRCDCRFFYIQCPFSLNDPNPVELVRYKGPDCPYQRIQVLEQENKELKEKLEIIRVQDRKPRLFRLDESDPFVEG